MEISQAATPLPVQANECPIILFNFYVLFKAYLRASPSKVNCVFTQR